MIQHIELYKKKRVEVGLIKFLSLDYVEHGNFILFQYIIRM
jgi:hypothetical protein